VLVAVPATPVVTLFRVAATLEDDEEVLEDDAAVDDDDVVEDDEDVGAAALGALTGS
jgi:hypothetical protein